MPKVSRQKIVIIGCGNMAWHLAKKLSSLNKFDVDVYNHKPNEVLKSFNTELKCKVHNNLNKINSSAKFYFVCVNDSSIKLVSAKIKNLTKSAIVVHTSGNSDIKKLQNKGGIKGVIYPLQTFSKEVEFSWNEIPLFIEVDDKINLPQIKLLAKLFSKKIRILNSADRAKLHLMAVFVNNFTNALYTSASVYLKAELKYLDFKLLLPLIEQTTLKVKSISPQKAQTGPVKRGDKKVMKAHLQLLRKHKDLKKLYKQFSSLIQKQN